MMRLYFSTLLLLVSITAHSDIQVFQSGSQRTPLLELYSSQGCSSCPPAERWVSRLKHHPNLWSGFIPIVFHVDYWDYLGWKDPFSNRQFSQRQRNYHSLNAIRSVYTPGMIYDGKEWRGWYRNTSPPLIDTNSSILRAKLTGNKLTAQFESTDPIVLNVALLGFDVQTHVTDGENQGRQFTEDFLILKSHSSISKNGAWEIEIDTSSDHNAKRYALAIWVNKTNDLMPLQSTGGWIQQNH